MSPGDIRPEPNVARFGLETFRRMSPGDIRAVARHSEKLVRALTFLHWFPLGNGLETFVAECRQRMSPMSPANECRKRMSPNVANVAKGRECRQCRQETFRMSPGDFQPWDVVGFMVKCVGFHADRCDSTTNPTNRTHIPVPKSHPRIDLPSALIA